MPSDLLTDGPELSERLFKRFRELIYEKAGISLGPDKIPLVSARVRKRLRHLKMARFEEYYDFVQRDDTGAELVELLNVISTNVTHFFREPRHFDFLHAKLRVWANSGQTRFRIWCAAASTGEEPYSIAITAHEALADTRDFKILATDISTKVLAAAKAGIYDEKQIARMNKKYTGRYFNKTRTLSGVQYSVINELRRMITFARLNLVSPPFPMSGPFDVIFCRNVMIYFDNHVRRKLLDECTRLLRPGGYLIVGHAESLSGMLCHLKSVEPAIYVK